MKKVNITQSLIKEIDKDGCSIAIKHFLSGTKTKPSEAMLCGLYFEHYLIGGCRGGQVPEFKALKNGNKPKAQTDLDKLIKRSKHILEANNIVIHEVQPEYKSDDIVGHFDAMGEIDGEKCIIDVKWTATKQDQKYNFGWADPTIKEDAHLQATHYVYTYYLTTFAQERLPFYFLVFGKSGWIKKIRFDITEAALMQHDEKIKETRAKLKAIIDNNFAYEPHFGQCSTCRYKDSCDSFSYKLKTEEYEIDDSQFI
jgi:hypothetical protein